MANEEAFLTITADNTGSCSPDDFASETRPVRFSDAAAASFGSSDELQKESPREQSLDVEFPTQGLYFSICPNCFYPQLLDNATQQHSDYCDNIYVESARAEPSPFNDREERNAIFQDYPRQSTHTISSGTLMDSSPSTTTAVPSAPNTATANLADAYDNTTVESHDTDEPSLHFFSIQPSQLPYETNNQPQPVMKSGRHTSDNVTSSDEQGNQPLICPTCQKDFTNSRSDSYARHMRGAHKPGKYPCPHPKCKKFKFPFKRADKLQNHRRDTCKIERQLRETTSPS